MGTKSDTAVYWRTQLQRFKAREIKSHQIHLYPNESVAFETQNFGWILSAQDSETGKRKILLQF